MVASRIIRLLRARMVAMLVSPLKEVELWKEKTEKKKRMGKARTEGANQSGYCLNINAKGTE